MIRPRLTLLAVVVMLAAVLYFVVIVPLTVWRQSSIARLSSVQIEIAQLETRIASLAAEKQSFVTDDLTGLTWEASQLAEATAKVQSSVNDTARGYDIAMRSITPTTGSDEGIENALHFRLEFEAHLDQLVSFLTAVEFDQPALVVTRANLRRLSRPDQNNPQPELFVQIDLAAPVTLVEEGEG